MTLEECGTICKYIAIVSTAIIKLAVAVFIVGTIVLQYQYLHAVAEAVILQNVNISDIRSETLVKLKDYEALIQKTFNPRGTKTVADIIINWLKSEDKKNEVDK